MDMDTYMMELHEQELQSMKDLLAQYQSEICDLRAGTGLAKMMNKKEIMYAEKNLEDHIESLVENIMKFEAQYNYSV